MPMTNLVAMITLTAALVVAQGCRKRADGDDASDLAGVGGQEVVVSGDQPISGNPDAVVNTDKNGKTGTKYVKGGTAEEGLQGEVSVDLGANRYTNVDLYLQPTIDGDTIQTHSWAQISGPGTLTFGDADALKSFVEAGTDGLYVIRHTATDIYGNEGSDELSVTWDTHVPIVNLSSAGIHNSAYTQNASVNNGDPADNPSPLSYQWTAQSGPGIITFGSPTSEDTTVNASADGTYVLRLTTTDGATNSGYDEETLVWDATAPAVNAGSDSTSGSSISQDATVTDATALTFAWTKVSGPGTVTFGTPNAEDTTISVDTDGTYVLRITATDAAGNSASDTLTYIYDSSAPTVNAGSDATTASQVSQNATASGVGMLTYAWTQISGPGTVSFGSANAEDTTISANADGVYVIRLTVTDPGAHSAFDEMTLTWDPTPPVVNAGTDKAVNASTPQDATVTDFSAVTYSWSQISGPGTISFGTDTAQDTTIAASLYGIYTVRLTATDALGNSASDDITFKWIRFNLGWSFDTPAEYTYNGGDIQVSGGGVSLIPVSLASAVDTTSGNFNAGTHGNTTYSSGLRLNAAGLTAKTGTFTSRVMDAAAPVNWDDISWTTDRPYQKDLPDGGIVETTFDAGNADMTGNAFLIHMNETSGTTLADTSGNGNTATCTACPTLNQSAVIGTAPTFASSFYTAPVNSALRISGDATFSAWIYPTSLSSYQYILERGNNDVDNYAFFTTNTKLSVEFVDTATGAYHAYDSVSSTLTTNTWQHVAAVFNDAANTLTFYRNGVAMGAAVAVPYTMKSTMNDSLYIGKQNFGSANFYWPGKLDEISIFNRALSQAEIVSMYERGGISVRFQVRGCADATCSSNPTFVGSDGTNATYFGNYPTAGQGAAWPIIGVTGLQYLQYRTTFDTYSSSITPVVKTVSFAQFLNTAPTIVTNNGYPYTSLVGFVPTVGTDHLGTVYYQLSPNGTNWYYHNGTTWTAAANSVAQANTAVTVNARISSFHSVVGAGTLYVRAYLNATGGAETISLQDMIVTGDNAGL